MIADEIRVTHWGGLGEAVDKKLSIGKVETIKEELEEDTENVISKHCRTKTHALHLYNASEAVVSIFTWSETKEGPVFWQHVRNRLLELSRKATLP